MRWRFGKESAAHLKQVNPSLRRVVQVAMALQLLDFRVKEPRRSGRELCRSVELVAHPTTRGEVYSLLAGLILAVAHQNGVRVRWAGAGRFELVRASSRRK